MADAQTPSPAPIVNIGQPLVAGAQAIDPGATAKSAQSSLAEALAAIPAGDSHALFLDATYDSAQSSSTGVKLVYVQKLGAGWSVAAEGDYYGTGHEAGKIVIGKSW